MRQRFFTSTAQTRLIKDILANTPIPIYDTVRPGDYIIKNCKYIYNISLIRCTKSGTLEGTGEFITLDYTFYWGAAKLNHTERLKDATGFYDSKVHEWLGRYLRAYRDMVGINLMPFYNCFSGVYTSRFKLISAPYVNNYPDSISGKTVTGTKITVYEADQSYDTYSQGSDQFNATYVDQSPSKILQIPVKLNRTYTIAVDCDSTVRIAPAFINHGHLVKVSIGAAEESITNILIDNKDEQGIISPISMEKTNTVFTKPFTITINSRNQSIIGGIITKEDIGLTYEQLLQRYEKYLYLLIELPKDNTSSVVVLEGDYTDTSKEKLFSTENITDINIDIYDAPEEYTASVMQSSDNNSSLSKAPYVSYFDVEGLQFRNNRLYSTILSILPVVTDPDTETETVLEDDYGYIEYAAKNVVISGSNATSNFQIYSYVPIPLGTTFKFTWHNAVDTESESYTEFTSNSDIHVYNDIEDNDVLLDKLLLSRLSLLQLNDGKNYPFADRLIEYLTLNVIDSADEIGENIKKVQSYFGATSRNNSTYGVWNNYLRSKVYLDTINQRTITHLDSTGYVDKDIEAYMGYFSYNKDEGLRTVNKEDIIFEKKRQREKEINQSITSSQSTINSMTSVTRDSLLVNPSISTTKLKGNSKNKE